MFDELLIWRPERVERFTIEINGECNLRCLYCPQNIDGYIANKPLSEALFEELLAYIKAHKIKRVDLTGGGEATFAAGWPNKVKRLLDLDVEVSLNTNMARLLTYAEMTLLSRFHEITVSIDTVDRNTLRKIRKSVDIRTIVYNFAMMRAAAILENRRPPHTVLCMVFSAEVVEMMDWLASLAISLNFDTFLIQDLVEYPNIKENVRSVWDLKGEEAKCAAAALSRFLIIFDRPSIVTKFCMPEQLRREMDEFISGALNGSSALGGPEIFVGEFMSKTTHSTGVQAGFTRDCMDPWTFIQVLSNGLVRPCCQMRPLGILGRDGQIGEILNSEAAQHIRAGLLTGNLVTDCRACCYRSATSVEALRARLENTLHSAGDDRSCDDAGNVSHD